MPDAFAIALPLVLAAVLVASASAKLRIPDDIDGWADLGVPTVLRREWLRRLHPWGELLLGAAIAVFGGWLGLIAALVAVALMVGYTVLVARVAARPVDTSCACFGARRRVTRITVLRNVWLTVVAVATAAVIWTTPLIGGALAVGIPQFPWLVSLAVAAVTTALVLWPEPAGGTVATAPPLAARASAGAGAAGSDGELDYVRTRTPAVPVSLADGTVVSLRKLAERKPILLLAVSSMCGPCETTVGQLPAFRALLPEVDVRLLLAEPIGMSPYEEHTEPQSLHDVGDYVSASIGDWATPTAVLLGVDGMLAGGPVTGTLAIERFVDDIYESLHGDRPVREGSPA